MDATVFPQGNTGTSDRPGRDGSFLLAIDPNGCRKRHAPVFGTNIVDVSLNRVAFEVDQVDCAFIVHNYLRLYAAIWNADGPDTLTVVRSRIRATACDGKSNYCENVENPSFHFEDLQIFNQSLDWNGLLTVN
jgi:hypothetical protein